MTTITVTDAAFPAPDVVPIQWFHSLLADVPSEIRSIVIEMITGLIPDDAQDNTKPLNLLLALDKRITYPDEWLRIWTSVDAAAEKIPGFTNVIETFGVFKQTVKGTTVQKCYEALSTTIETLWARNGSTLRRTLLVYDPSTPIAHIELASAAHTIIECSKVRGFNPTANLANIVAQLNGQLRVVDEPISAWSAMISGLPENFRTDATCRLSALIAHALTPPHY
jgi:hypothetical protein